MASYGFMTVTRRLRQAQPLPSSAAPHPATWVLIMNTAGRNIKVNPEVRNGNSYETLQHLLSGSEDQRIGTKQCLLVGCLPSQQHAGVSQGRICSDNCTCCHTEIEAADQTFHITQSQYTDTGPTSPSTDPTTPDAWQGYHWSANFLSH